MRQLQHLFLMAILLCLTTTLKADQLAYLSFKDADRAAQFIKTQKEVIDFCGCCDNANLTRIGVSNALPVYTGYEDFYEIHIEGYDLTDESSKHQIFKSIDLAYLYVNIDGVAYDVGQELGLECDPCIASFDWHTLEPVEEFVEIEDIDYNPELALELGADEYGMRQYVIAFLWKGHKREDYTADQRADFQRQHLDNIRRLADEGKLSIAGPFLDDSDLRGIYIFNVASVKDAEALTNTDPAIQAGILKMELKPWYGSAALLQIPSLHKSIAKQNP